MPVPKRKTSKSKKNTRRSHDRLKLPAISLCAESGEVKAPHCVGPTGYYKGRLVIPALAKRQESSGDLTASDFE